MTVGRVAQLARTTWRWCSAYHINTPNRQHKLILEESIIHILHLKAETEQNSAPSLTSGSSQWPVLPWIYVEEAWNGDLGFRLQRDAL